MHKLANPAFWLLFLLLVGLGIFVYSEWETRSFVYKFVASVHQDTDFYKPYIHIHDVDSAQRAREWMTSEFTLEQEGFSLEGFCYTIRFKNGAVGHVIGNRWWFREENVGFVVNPPNQRSV